MSTSNLQSPASSWKPLCKIGGVAALLTAVFVPIHAAVFIASSPPLEGTAADWFAFVQASPLVGLIDLDLLLVADLVLMAPIVLAIYVLIRRDGESAMLLAAALTFLSIVAYVVANPAVEVLTLSGQYAAATGEAQRAALLAAGQSALADWLGTTFHAGYLLGSVAGITIGAVMLRGSTFSRLTAYMGILGNAVGLGIYVPVVGLYISLFSVLFLELWYVLVGVRLLQVDADSR